MAALTVLLTEDWCADLNPPLKPDSAINRRQSRLTFGLPA